MNSSTTPEFRELFEALPAPIKVAAKKQYRLWRDNPRHPSLQFKKVEPFWSVRVTQDYRALALLRHGVYYWFWIGTHAEYDQWLHRT
jgi:uncharacterized membrane protein